MNAKKLEWTDDRYAELEEFRKLLRLVSSLNSGNLFLEKVQDCIEIAERLQSTNFARSRFEPSRPSFVSWLERSTE